MEEPICALCKEKFKTHSKVRFVSTPLFLGAGIGGTSKLFYRNPIRNKSTPKIYHYNCAKLMTIDNQDTAHYIVDFFEAKESNKEIIYSSILSVIFGGIGIIIFINNTGTAKEFFIGLILIILGIVLWLEPRKRRKRLLRDIKILESKKCSFNIKPEELN